MCVAVIARHSSYCQGLSYAESPLICQSTHSRENRGAVRKPDGSATSTFFEIFEVNPSGQWGWLEERTGLPMRRALLDLLFAGA